MVPQGPSNGQLVHWTKTRSSSQTPEHSMRGPSPQEITCIRTSQSKGQVLIRECLGDIFHPVVQPSSLGTTLLGTASSPVAFLGYRSLLFCVASSRKYQHNNRKVEWGNILQLPLTLPTDLFTSQNPSHHGEGDTARGTMWGAGLSALCSLSPSLREHRVWV